MPTSVIVKLWLKLSDGEFCLRETLWRSFHRRNHPADSLKSLLELNTFTFSCTSARRSGFPSLFSCFAHSLRSLSPLVSVTWRPAPFIRLAFELDRVHRAHIFEPPLIAA